MAGLRERLQEMVKEENPEDVSLFLPLNLIVRSSHTWRSGCWQAK